jgi:hypothetical protein
MYQEIVKKSLPCEFSPAASDWQTHAKVEPGPSPGGTRQQETDHRRRDSASSTALRRAEPPPPLQYGGRPSAVTAATSQRSCTPSRVA